MSAEIFTAVCRLNGGWAGYVTEVTALPPCDWQDSTPARQHCTRDATVRRNGRALCAAHADLADERKAARP